MFKRLPAKFTPIESQRERNAAESYDSNLLFELGMTSGNQIDTSDPFTEENVGRQFSWTEVSKIHKTRNGIYQRHGNLISLLTDFGKINPCYPDFHGDTQNTIHYTGSGRRGNQKLDIANKAMIDAVGTGIAVPLFNKLGVNRWEFLGSWRVADANYIFDESRERMVWKFRLELSS
jgi:hypothetical protein